MATSLPVPLMASVVLAGVTLIELSVACVTVSVVDPERLPTAALIVVVPAASVVASWVVASIDATFPALDFQVALLETSEIVPSEKVPVAVKATLTPIAAAGFVGLIAMDTNWALVTVKVAVPLIAPTLALMVAMPA